MLLHLFQTLVFLRHVLISIVVQALILRNSVDLVRDVVCWCFTITDVLESLGDVTDQGLILRLLVVRTHQSVHATYRKWIRVPLGPDIDRPGPV